MYIHIYICMCMYICMCVCVYIYIYFFFSDRLAKVFKPDKTKFWRNYREMETLCSAYKFVIGEKYTVGHFDSNK